MHIKANHEMKSYAGDTSCDLPKKILCSSEGRMPIAALRDNDVDPWRKNKVPMLRRICILRPPLKTFRCSNEGRMPVSALRMIFYP